MVAWHSSRRTRLLSSTMRLVLGGVLAPPKRLQNECLLLLPGRPGHPGLSLHADYLQIVILRKPDDKVVAQRLG